MYMYSKPYITLQHTNTHTHTHTHTQTTCPTIQYTVHTHHANMDMYIVQNMTS